MEWLLGDDSVDTHTWTTRAANAAARADEAAAAYGLAMDCDAAVEVAHARLLTDDS